MATANSRLKIDFGFDSQGTSNVVGDMEITGSLSVGGNLVFSGTSVGNFLPDVDQRSLGNTTSRWNLQGFTANLGSTLTVAGATTLQDTLAVTRTISSGNVTVTGFANVSTSVNSALITVGTNLIANTTGVYHTGTVNAASITTSGFVANTTAIVPTSNTRLLGNNTGRWVVSANTGNFSGAVSVTGTTTLSGNATLNGALQTISGNTNLTGTLVLAGNASFSNTLSLTGAATLSNNLTVAGVANINSNVNILGVTSISNNITVTGTATATGNASVAGGILLVNTNIGTNSNTITIGAANVSVDAGVLFVDSVNNRVGVNNTAPGVALRVTGAADISLTANIQGNANVGGALGVAGITTLSSNAILNGSLQTVAGNVNFDSGVLFVDSVSNRVGINTTTPSVALDVAGVAKISTSVNSALLSVGSNFIANTTAIVGTGYANIATSVNSALLTVGTNFRANTSGAYHTGTVNALSHTTTGVTANVTGVYPTSNTSGSALGSANRRWVVNGNTGNFSTSVSISTINATSNGFFASENLITVGNSTINVAIVPAGITISGGDGLNPSSNIRGYILGTDSQRWELKAQNGNFANDVVISGNLTVSGTTTYINTTNLNIGDNIVTLNADLGAVAPTENAGLEINRGSAANVYIIWNESSDAWNLGNTTFSGAISATSISTPGYQANSTALNPTSNTILLGNTVGRWVITANSLTTSGSGSIGTTFAAGNTTVTGFANVTTSVNSALLTVGTSFIANTLGVYHTGVVNAASLISSGFVANTLGAYHVGTVNAASLTVGSNFIANTIGAYHTGIVNAATVTVGSNFRANTLGAYHTGIINAASHTIGTNFIANTVGLYHSGTVNAAFHTIGTTFIANTVGLYHTGTVDATSLTVGSSFRANTLGAYHTGIVNAVSHTTSGFVANTTSISPTSNTILLGNSVGRWVLSANSGNFSGDVSLGSTLTANGTTGTSGQVLISSSSANAYWGDAGVSVSDDITTNTSRYVVFNDTTSGLTSNVGVSSTKLTFNPFSGILSAVEFTATSDERLKSNITTIADALSKVSNLRGVDYTYSESGKKSIGVIAQEVELVIPEVVAENSDGYKSVNYGNIVGLLIEAIKELKLEIEELKNGNQS